MTSGSPDPQGERGLQQHMHYVGGVEGSGRYFKLPAHSLHQLPGLPPWILVRSRHNYRHPQGQNALAVSGHEGGGPFHDFSGSTQGI